MQNKRNNLLEAFLSLENKDLCARFLSDITTPKELRDLEERFEVAQLLHEGKTYEKINEETGMSSTTIARINRTLHDGQNGYKDVLRKMNQEK
ncbi:MAG: YerC/YecD family TrpR-related protein [Atopostipes sp.]|nr:YerC/YecD family TrpR-related protein [Atopostipes sp.]